MQVSLPGGIDIQGQLALIADGQYEEALKLIKESNPLPAVCGRVCPRFCEQSCRRNLVDEPVSINALKRFVADYDLANGPYVPEVKMPIGHRIAVIGGGPAGLSAAYFLALEGHQVTIFDSGPQLGGMLRYGIPEYRLPKAELDKEIATITALCEEVRLNTALGEDFTIESLQQEGFGAIFVALGAQASQKMRVEGEDLLGVLPGVNFLRDVVLGKEIALGEKVAVIGGGNTAMDAARTALRLSAKQVMVVYRRSRNEMPANPEEVEEAEHEGAEFHFLSAPVRIIGKGGRAVAVECVKMELGEADSSGRRRPTPVKGSEFLMAVDTVIAAIGQTLDMPSLDDGTELNISSRGYVEVDKETMETSIEGVFSGGDCASGPATVVQAVGAGKRAAHSIHQYLNGQSITAPAKPFNSSKGELSEIDPAEFGDRERISRAKMPSLTVKDRWANFLEVEKGLSEDEVWQEAMRCLSCGCQDVFDCELRKHATDYGIEASKFEGEKHHHPIPDDHPFIARDANKCILCGRCARICTEVMGIGAISFVDRGFNTVVKPSLGLPLDETQCESCGQCISTCPTGALTAKSFTTKPGPWQTNEVPSACTQCGINCSINLRSKGNRIVEITSPVGNVVNDGNLCWKGAFGYSYIHADERLKTPLIRRKGRLVPVSWDEALGAAGKGLGEVKSQYGSSKLAVLASPKLTNEENYLAQKLARMALRTNNIGNSFGMPENDALTQFFGSNSSTCSFGDIPGSDLILVFGNDVCTNHPIVALKIKDAVSKGSKLIVINSEATRLDPHADMALKISQRMTEELLQTVLNYIFHYQLIDHHFVEKRTLGLQVLERNMRPYSMGNWADAFWVKPAKIIEFVHMYIRAKNPLIIVNADIIDQSELTLLSNLALVTGNVARDGAGIIALRNHGNGQGQIDMGVAAEYLPGQEPIFDGSARQRLKTLWGDNLPKGKGAGTRDIIEKARKGQVKGLLVIGASDIDVVEEALGDGRAFTVVVAPVLTEAISKADVILPGTTFAETEGTLTSSEKRIQRLNEAIAPLAGRRTWQVLSDLSTALGYSMSYSGVPEIFEEIAKAVPSYAEFDYGRIPADGVQLPVCDEQSAFISSQWLEGIMESGARKKSS